MDNVIIIWNVFISWLSTEWFTLVSIILSGLISLAISAFYYRRGNRNSLQMSVIFPIIHLLNEDYSRNNYEKLYDLSTNYLCKYFKSKEKKLLIHLVFAYKEIKNYNRYSVDAEAIVLYFEDTLKKQNINPKPVPVEYDGEFIYDDYPPDFHYIYTDIEKVLKEYEFDYETENCVQYIITILSDYCNKYYTNQQLPLFEDLSILQIVQQSPKTKQWEEKFKNLTDCKSNFLQLKIVKQIATNIIIPEH